MLTYPLVIKWLGAFEQPPINCYFDEFIGERRMLPLIRSESLEINSPSLLCRY